MTTVEPAVAEIIKSLHESRRELFHAPILGAEFPALAAKLKESSIALARHHRNWNETTGEPDGMIEYFEGDAPAGAKTPAVASEDLTSIEQLSEDILYGVSIAKLENPTIGAIENLERVWNAISDLATYHPEFNERNGEIG